ncbi:MAG: ABC transporter permease [Gemmatimonadetes bacterium]|nr:ABC transporter permease [Gemmatimonadota bacterium]
MASPFADRIAVRLYRLALHLYPAKFRADFGPEMMQHFTDGVREARSTRRTVGLARVCGETAVDLVRSLRREWMSWLRPDRRFTHRLGNHPREGIKERLARPMTGILKDLQYAFRTLRREPVFTIVAVLTLGLGIGASTTIFSVVNGVLLKPLQYSDPDRLVVIYTDLPKIGLFKVWSSGPEILDYRDQSHLFEHVAYVRGGGGLTMTGEGDAEQVSGMFLSWDVLPMLGVTPALGRLPAQEEDVPNGPLTTMLSYEFWERRFGSDPDIVGRTLVLAGNGYTIIGVMPTGFTLNLPGNFRVPPTADLWIPSQTDLVQWGRHNHGLVPIARLAPGVTPELAVTEAKVIGARLNAEHYDETTGFNLHVYGLHDDLVQKSRPALFALLAAVGFVLLIACANVANLILARGTVREKELALRAALGAARSRIVRQILTESTVLAVLGAAAGLALAAGGMRWLKVLNPANLPRLETISLNGTVLAFTVGASVLTAFLFGLAPALQITAPDIHESLKDGGRSHSAGRVRNRMRGALVVSEVALSLVLLIGAGLMIRSFMLLYQVPPGFDPANTVTFQVTLSSSKYSAAQRAPFFQQLEERIAGLPGVEAVGAVHALPLSGVWGWSGPSTFYETTNGREANRDYFEVDRRVITPGYFRAMGTRLLAGRFLDERDDRDGIPVAVIDETLAQRVWPDADPIGKRMAHGDNPDNPTFIEVVGVVEHLRHHQLDAVGREQVYYPESQRRFGSLVMVVRAERDPLTLVAGIRNELRSLDPDIPAYNVGTMEGYVTQAVAPTRFNLVLLGVFAGVGLLLTVVGIYGVIAYSVGQRKQELGIRRALGAQHRDVVSIVLRQGMALTLTGVGIGLVGALAVTRFARSLLFEVTATDPLTYAGVGLLLIGVSALACYLPARKAGNVDPMVALRAQ